MNFLVSACITGCNCKYNGGNNLNLKVVEFLKGKEIIEICPEMLVEMSIPRASAEIVGGCVTECNGIKFHREYEKGVELALDLVGN